MPRETQGAGNPFVYSDTNKRYHTYDYYLRHTFGEKCAKIVLDAGFTCPNRDGRCGSGGCIYCSGRGSGDFACSPSLGLAEQYRRQREILSQKWSFSKTVAYLQPHTNTYAPVERLREVYEEALALPGVVGMNIATRADCLPDEVIELLAELSEKTVLTVELGLQTVHDETAALIGRGHDFACFLDAWERMRQKAPRVRLGAHLIFGLIGESDEMMVQSVQKLADLCPDEVKLHYLYVLEGTEIARIYRDGGYFPIEKDRYTDLVVSALELLPPETVIARLTGDGEAKKLLAPLWGVSKRKIFNEIDKKMYERDTWQGKKRPLSEQAKP